MYRNARALERAFEERQSAVRRTIADCGHLAPALLGARERLEADLARQGLLRDAGPGTAPRPGRVRRWCGAQAIRLGAWLGGDGVPTRTALPATPQTPPGLP
jgi:hypothetical protein